MKIKNYPNYTISEEGVVTNIKNNKILKHTLTHQGYLEVQLWNKGIGRSILVHRLVAMHYIENNDTENKLHVHHKDNNRQNCHYTNLEWVTPKENINYRASRNGGGKVSKIKIIKLYKSKKWNSVEDFLIEVVKM